MAVDLSDIVSLDTKVVVEAIENQGTTSIITALTAVTAAVNAITQGAEDLSTDDVIAALEALDLATIWTYGATDEELYQTDGNGGTNPDVDDTERYTNDIDLTEERGATITIKFDGSDATDDLIISLYARQDDAWEDVEIALSSVTVASDGSEDIYTITITPAYGAGHYRIGMVRSGASTTFEIDAQMRRWR